MNSQSKSLRQNSIIYWFGLSDILLWQFIVHFPSRKEHKGKIKRAVNPEFPTCNIPYFFYSYPMIDIFLAGTSYENTKPKD